MASNALDSHGAAALALWAKMCADPSIRETGWVTGPDAPTFTPFDTLDVLRGAPSIVRHLAGRDRAYGAGAIEADPVACWSDDGGVIVVAEARLRLVPSGGEAELRRMMLVLAATTEGVVHLRHVTEAVPAVLPLVIESYRRPAAP